MFVCNTHAHTCTYISIVALVDSASTTAAAAADMLAALDLRNQAEHHGRLKLLATDGAMRFARVGGWFLGTDLTADDVDIVDL